MIEVSTTIWDGLDAVRRALEEKLPRGLMPDRVQTHPNFQYEIEALCEGIGQLEYDVVTQESIDTLDDEIERLEGRIESLDEERQDAERECAKLEEENAALRDELVELQQHIANLGNEIDSLHDAE